MVRKQLRDHGRKIDHELQAIFTSKKVVDDLREKGIEAPVASHEVVETSKYSSFVDFLVIITNITLDKLNK